MNEIDFQEQHTRPRGFHPIRFAAGWLAYFRFKVRQYINKRRSKKSDSNIYPLW